MSELFIYLSSILHFCRLGPAVVWLFVSFHSSTATISVKGYAESLKATADYTDFMDWDCRGSRVGCFALDVPLQDYFSATGFLASSMSFSNRGSPRNGSQYGSSFNGP